MHENINVLNKSMSLYHAFGAVIVMLLWSLCFPLINIGLESSPPMLFAALRALIAGLLLLLLAYCLHRPFPNSSTIWLATVVIGLTTTSLGFFGMFYGGGLVSPGIATVLANTQPLIAVLIAYYWLNEALGKRQKYGLVTGFIGIILISINFGGSEIVISRSGVMYIIIGALGVAFGNVALKWLAGKGDIWVLMGLQLVIGSVPLFIIHLLFESTKPLSWNISFISSLLVLSIFGTALVTVIWFALLARVELYRVNVFTFLAPVFALIIGNLYFDEALENVNIIGVLLSLISIYLVSYQPSKDISKI